MAPSGSGVLNPALGSQWPLQVVEFDILMDRTGVSVCVCRTYM